ncbi:5-hydroxytryptamine receptor 3A-like [Lepisosteus oculatus]|uniref:5-hydroxytryptamine receptor 3A-like n=1 Tax=Lepisosteus oculatus TaxID=7918 RepID=UPI00371C260F
MRDCGKVLQSILRLHLFLAVLFQSSSQCDTRRCLATSLVQRNGDISIQPETKDCKVNVFLKDITFETLEVNTQNLYFSSLLRINMVWNDSSLSWDSTYPYEEVVLPVSDVWIPSLSVKNALKVETQPESSHLLVFRNGTVYHKELMWITVGCDFNLYLYPFTNDWCVIALDGWNSEGCGEKVTFGRISLIGKTRGDWRAVDVRKDEVRNASVFLVSLSTRGFNVIVSLIIPTFLIMLADIVSFILPLVEGERISFKVTLVLGFVMFLLILSDMLPGTSQCAPLIRYHFCVCLFFLVLSMIESMVVTQLAVGGSLFSFHASGCSIFRDTNAKSRRESQDNKNEMQGYGLELLRCVTEPHLDNRSLQRIVKVLENMQEKEQDTQNSKCFANKVDKICFFVYLGSFILYVVVMLYFICDVPCEINHFDF